MVNLLPIRGSDGEVRIVNQQELPKDAIVDNRDGTFALRADVSTDVADIVNRHAIQEEIAQV